MPRGDFSRWKDLGDDFDYEQLETLAISDIQFDDDTGLPVPHPDTHHRPHHYLQHTTATINPRKIAKEHVTHCRRYLHGRFNKHKLPKPLYWNNTYKWNEYSYPDFSEGCYLLYSGVGYFLSVRLLTYELTAAPYSIQTYSAEC